MTGCNQDPRWSPFLITIPGWSGQLQTAQTDSQSTWDSSCPKLLAWWVIIYKIYSIYIIYTIYIQYLHYLYYPGHAAADPDDQRVGAAGVGWLQALLEPGGLRRGQVPPRAQPGHLAAGHRAIQQVGLEHLYSDKEEKWGLHVMNESLAIAWTWAKNCNNRTLWQQLYTEASEGNRFKWKV